MTWFPHVTVATIVEDAGRFLMVEEVDNGHRVFNQPAGHLEDGESLVAAAVRETLEETGWHVTINGFLGLYHYRSPQGVTYIRHCFTAQALAHDATRPLDEGIIAAHWLDLTHINADDFPVRSVAVRQVLADYRHRSPYPLDLIHHENETHHD